MRARASAAELFLRPLVRLVAAEQPPELLLVWPARLWIAACEPPLPRLEFRGLVPGFLNSAARRSPFALSLVSRAPAHSAKVPTDCIQSRRGSMAQVGPLAGVIQLAGHRRTLSPPDHAEQVSPFRRFSIVVLSAPVLALHDRRHPLSGRP